MTLRVLALAPLSVLVLSAMSCTAVAPGADVRSAVPATALPAGVTEYILVEDVSRVPFIVIQADSYGDDGFDLYLRDELAKAGFPRGVTRAQLGRVYLDAGLGNVAQSVDDPLAMYQLSRAVGPFLVVRVSYEIGGWGGTTYDVSVWDAASSRSVFKLKRTQMVWLKLSREIGPPIVAALAQWRNDCLEAAKTMPEQRT